MGSLRFSDLSVYINFTITKLSGIKQAVKWTKIDQFTELKQSAENEILNLHTTWETFFNYIFHNLVNNLFKKWRKALASMSSWEFSNTWTKICLRKSWWTWAWEALFTLWHWQTVLMAPKTLKSRRWSRKN